MLASAWPLVTKLKAEMDSDQDRDRGALLKLLMEVIEKAVTANFPHAWVQCGLDWAGAFAEECAEESEAVKLPQALGSQALVEQFVKLRATYALQLAGDLCTMFPSLSKLAALFDQKSMDPKPLLDMDYKLPDDQWSIAWAQCLDKWVELSQQATEATSEKGPEKGPKGSPLNQATQLMFADMGIETEGQGVEIHKQSSTHYHPCIVSTTSTPTLRSCRAKSSKAAATRTMSL